MKSLFGPNSALKLSIKKHNDILRAINSNLEENEIGEYIDYLKQMLDSANVEDYYPKY